MALPGRVGVRWRAAVFAPAAAAVAAGASVALHLVAPAGGPHLRFADLMAGLSFSLAGVMVLRREPRNAAGRLLVATVALALGPLLNEAAWRVLASHPGSRTGSALLWVTNWIWVPYLLLPTVLVLLLPHGRLPSRRWRPVAVAIIVVTAVVALCAMTRPGGSDQIATIDNPLGIGGAEFLNFVMAVGVGLVLGVGSALCLGGLFVRLRSASGVERAQLQWLAAGASAAATAFAGSVAAPWPLGEILLGVGIAALPCAIAIAVWRHQLYDVEIVLNRALASLGLVVAGLLLYGAVVAASDRLAPIAAAALALVAASIWRRTQRVAGRLLYGAREEPLVVVERVGSKIEAVAAPAQALQSLVETVHDALRLPYVAVKGAGLTASVGSPVATVDEFPCSARGERVALLAIGHRHDGERWRDDERALFLDSARRAGALVEAGRLVADLERSRNSLVAGREEERRRLRRDLHDGVASALSGISLQLDCLDEQNPELVGEAIVQIRQSTRAVANEVRALVNDLRPPALDQLGLVGAVRELAGAWSASLVVVVDAGRLPALPAATEVAAYRIASEAVVNAARHGAASECRVCFDIAPPWLLVDVRDDGRGFDTTASGGVGVEAMYTRATEVGGALELVSDSTGTHVLARLPLEIR
jgi:signal transduction histidine kinase